MAKNLVGIMRAKYKCRKCKHTHHYGAWIYFEHLSFGGIVTYTPIVPHRVELLRG
jgi:hypothetical protein